MLIGSRVLATSAKSLAPRCAIRAKSLAATIPEPPSAPSVTPQDLVVLNELEDQALWLSTLMIHSANNERPKRDGLKVGGHQASSSSVVSILTALYFHELKAHDRVAVKPHAGPVYHAIQYMMGRQKLENLQNFRGYGGVQSYPSRTKDFTDVDFSTGSVGFGPAISTFAAIIEQYLRDKGMNPPPLPGLQGETDPGRMVAILGDAELDEGNVFEGLLESWKLDAKNNWYVKDLVAL